MVDVSIACHLVGLLCAVLFFSVQARLEWWWSWMVALAMAVNAIRLGLNLREVLYG